MAGVIEPAATVPVMVPRAPTHRDVGPALKLKLYDPDAKILKITVLVVTQSPESATLHYREVNDSR